MPEIVSYERIGAAVVLSLFFSSLKEPTISKGGEKTSASQLS